MKAQLVTLSRPGYFIPTDHPRCLISEDDRLILEVGLAGCNCCDCEKEVELISRCMHRSTDGAYWVRERDGGVYLGWRGDLPNLKKALKEGLGIEIVPEPVEEFDLLLCSRVFSDTNGLVKERITKVWWNRGALSLGRRVVAEASMAEKVMFASSYCGLRKEGMSRTEEIKEAEAGLKKIVSVKEASSVIWVTNPEMKEQKEEIASSLGVRLILMESERYSDDYGYLTSGRVPADAKAFMGWRYREKQKSLHVGDITMDVLRKLEKEEDISSHLR